MAVVTLEWKHFIGITAWVLLSLYAMWNVLGAATFVVGSGLVYVGLYYGVRRVSPSERSLVVGSLIIGAIGPMSALVVDRMLFPGLFVYDGIAVVGISFSAIAGYYFVASESNPVPVVLGSLLGLPIVYLATLWYWITPPCITCGVLGKSVFSSIPGWFLVRRSDAVAFLEYWAGLDLPILWLITVTATGIGTMVFVYVLLSMLGHILYSNHKGIKKVERLTVVLVSIASDNVRETLFEAIKHNRTLLSEYEFVVLIDEGADLQTELAEMDVDLTVVPDSFESNAIAKGRAMQYFVEHHVEDDRWYAFIDDDNLIQGREFLYEIPKREAEGRLVMNSILVPRKGESTIAFAIDHMRTLFDFTFFRTFTGLLGRPYAGLHGELLCARGDVLSEIGFDKRTIVEDFVFADELVKRGIRTWQSQTVTSILSPHTLDDYFTQRARWFTGKVGWLPRCSLGTFLVTSTIQGVWVLGIFGGYLVGAIWFLFGTPIQVIYLVPPIFSSAVYSIIYSVGIARLGVRHLPKILLVPVYATVEHAAPYVSIFKRTKTFEVIRK